MASKPFEHRGGKHIVVIIASIVAALAIVSLAHHAFYRYLSDAGSFCPPDSGSRRLDDVLTEGVQRSSGGFSTTQVCWASGLAVHRGATYEVELRTPGDWFDQTTRTDVAGYATDGLKHLLALPLLRRWDADWFQPILRVGAARGQEYLMKPTTDDRVLYPAYVGPPVPKLSPIDPAVAREILMNDPEPKAPRDASVRFTAEEDGELHLYVNDALPVVHPELFYRNNAGTGTLLLRKITSN